MDGSRSFSLLYLADELLLNIIEHVNSRTALQTLACTCSKLQSLTEPFIWTSLLVLSGSHAFQIAKSLRSRESRASGIRSLQVRYAQELANGIEALNPEMKKMSQLRELHVESSCPNNAGELGLNWGEGRIKIAEFFEFAMQRMPGQNPRVQVPLQTCMPPCRFPFHDCNIS
jgi:hypothetical protein